ncbi:hypothetical protein MKX03_021026 [Papaver bracteatum]|nr:hypothetical protein MKX03_021026 [Papaver bracteatum]
MEETYCSNCKSVTAVIKDHSTGDSICSDCRLAYSSEWRTFPDESNDNGDEPHRFGDNSNLLVSNNALTIIPPSSNSSLRRFNRKDSDKGLIKAFKATEAMSERLGLVSTVKDLANEIYKKRKDVKSSKRINKNAVLGACLYTACKRLEKPRTMKEISSVANGATKKEIGRATKHLEEIGNGDTEGSTHTKDAGYFVRRFCSILGMSNKVVKAAQEAVEKTAECDIRRNPATVAATIIYMISQLSDERKPVRDVADATGVAQGTISNSYKDIYKNASRLVPAWRQAQFPNNSWLPKTRPEFAYKYCYRESYCSDCKSVTAVISDHSTGDTICLDCVLVLEASLIDETSEWRTFSDEPVNNDPHRVGDKSNPLLSNNGLTTLISMPKGGEHQSQYPSSKSLGRFNHANMKDPDKGLIEAFRAIEAMYDRLGLVSTVNDLANEIYKKMEDLKSCKGKKKEAVRAACLFVACRRLENPRTLKEIHSAVNGVTLKEIGRANSDISKHLEESGDGDHGVCTNPADFVRRFCSLLGMGNQAVKAAQEAVEKTAECRIPRTPSPPTVAASIIFMITQLSDDRKQIGDVCDASGVKPATIKKYYKDIYPFASRLVPAWYANEENLNKLCQP